MRKQFEADKSVNFTLELQLALLVAVPRFELGGATLWESASCLPHRILSLSWSLRKQFERETACSSFPILGWENCRGQVEAWRAADFIGKKQETIFLSGQMASSVARSEHQGAPFKFGVEPKYPEVTLDYGTRVSDKWSVKNEKWGMALFNFTIAWIGSSRQKAKREMLFWSAVLIPLRWTVNR